MALYDELQIPFVPRHLSPPNCPQLRPNEHFFGHIEEASLQGLLGGQCNCMFVSSNSVSGSASPGYGLNGLPECYESGQE